MARVDFETLVDRHSAEIFGYLWRMVRDEADAQDCLQETYLRAYRAWGRLNARPHHRAWLYKIATNVGLTFLRKSRRQNSPLVELDAEMISGGPTPAEISARQALLERVRTAVERLPAQQRAALILRKYQELSYAEVAVALNCTETAARANVYQALKKLREQLADDNR